MRLPIRNIHERTMTIFMEPACDQYEVPVGGEAIVRIDDGMLDSIDVDDGWMTIWDNSCEAVVEVVSKEDLRVDDALRLASTWLHRMGGEAESRLLEKVVIDLEATAGYFQSRRRVFAAFHDGLTTEHPSTADPMPEDEIRAACYRAGVKAARLNNAARRDRAFPELNAPAPLDTDVVRLAFARALTNDD